MIGIFAIVAAFIAGTLPIASADAASSSSPASLAQVLQLVASATSIKNVPSSIQPPLQNADTSYGVDLAAKRGCSPAPTISTTGSCIYGDQQGSKTMVLVGDSHAAMWLAGFDEMAQRIHWKLVVLIKTECPAVMTRFWIDSLNRPYPECSAWHSYIVSRIRKLDPSIVVIANWWDYNKNINDKPITDTQWIQGESTMLKDLQGKGTQEVLWGDIPYLSQAGPTCLAAHLTNAQACTTPRSYADVSSHEFDLAAVAKQHAATYVSTTNLFCTSQCTAIVGSYDVYANASHITNNYAKFLSGAIQTDLQPLINQSSQGTK
jgi:hypothetical protein